MLNNTILIIDIFNSTADNVLYTTVYRYLDCNLNTTYDVLVNQFFIFANSTM